MRVPDTPRNLARYAKITSHDCNKRGYTMMNKETGLPRSSKDKNWEACRVGLTDIPRGATEARKLKWNSALECGINAIDAQHRELFEVSNALLETIHKNPSESEAALKVEVLINAVESHFRSEESLLAGWNHPLTEDHKAVHEDLLARANELSPDQRTARFHIDAHSIFSLMTSYMDISPRRTGNSCSRFERTSGHRRRSQGCSVNAETGCLDFQQQDFSILILR